ncbi:MAG TPA: hypothetical protein VHK27_01290 [Gammaproteobacteria bacterium]|nr:hypothetical protein [Gammaproteobacteria bacterium]
MLDSVATTSSRLSIKKKGRMLTLPLFWLMKTGVRLLHLIWFSPLSWRHPSPALQPSLRLVPLHQAQAVSVQPELVPGVAVEAELAPLFCRIPQKSQSMRKV